jgi:CheY-like chemotaxis protein
MVDPKDLHIIIAEDDCEDGEIIQQSFINHFAFSKVDMVQNGKELIDFLLTAPTKPHVILTDINMPILNGIEALYKICSDPLLSGIPSFAYSTTINPVYEAKCLQLGVKGFLIKPFTISEFDEIPSKILEVLLGKK